MKKLFTLLFTAVVAFALAMPVIAQEAPAGGEAPKTAKSKEKKPKKEKKAKEKKMKDAETK
jgi:hypothetical protein